MHKCFSAFAMLLVALLFTMGCKASASPTFDRAEFDSPEEQTDTPIILYISDEFRTFSAEQFHKREMKNWQLEIGPAAADAFAFAYEEAFQPTTTRYGAPQFPMNVASNTLIVVPQFAEYDGSAPLLFKLEDYKVELGIQVRVYTPNGSQVSRKTFIGKGEAPGKISWESAGETAFPQAIKDALRSIVRQSVIENRRVAR